LESIKRDKHLWLTLLISLTIILVAMLPRLLNPYSTEDDFLNWYWMNRFYDPDLFPNDPAIERNLLELTIGPVNLFIFRNSPLYGLLFQLFSPFIHFILLGKLLVFPLAALSVYCLYRISELFVTPAAAMVICLLFVLLNLILPSLVSFMGGFQRSFALPLLLAFSYAWWRQRYWVAFAILFVAGGIYPPLFVILMMTALLELMLFWWANRKTVAGRKYRLYLVGVLLVAFVVLGLLWPVVENRFLRLVTAFANSPSVAAVLADDGQHGPFGRGSLFYVFPFVGRGGLIDHGMTNVVVLFLTLFAAGIATWQPQRLRALPRVFKTLLAAGFIGFALAWTGFFLTAFFPFYLPSRYTQSVIFLALFIFVMVNTPDALQAAARWVKGKRSLLLGPNLLIAGFLLFLFFYLPVNQSGEPAIGQGATRWLLLALAALLVVLTGIVHRRARANPSQVSGTVRETDSRGRNVGMGLLILVAIIVVWALRPFMYYTYFLASDAQKEMFAFIQTLPKDSLLTGTPDANHIPMFGQRSVLLTYERLGPGFKGTIDALLAYYADDPDDLLAFCDQYGVSYLVVNEQDFIQVREPDHRYFYEPYHSIVAPQLEQRNTFVLEMLPDSARSFQQDEWSLVACTADVLR
jgi:hypothetical protein